MRSGMAKANCDICLKIRSEYPLRKQFEAEFLCYDFKKYLCSKCFIHHIDHATFSAEDKSNKTKLDKFCEEMMQQLTSEGDQILEKFTHEQTHFCDLVLVGISTWSQSYNIVDMGVPISLGDRQRVCDELLGIFTHEQQPRMIAICILHGSKQWVIADYENKCIRVFNINNNKMTHSCTLKHVPYAITEIASTNPSQSLIAVSLQSKKQVDIMNIHYEHNTRFQFIYCIHVQGMYYDLAYCNNKLIGLCCDYIDVIDMSGKIINAFNLPKLPDIKPNWFDTKCFSVHSETETIYVGLNRDPSCVISMSVGGQLLHYVVLTAMRPRHICVDRDQNVYVMDEYLPLYKLSSDLSQAKKVIDEEMIAEEFFDESLQRPCYFTSIACHADTFYLARSDGFVFIIRHE